METTGRRIHRKRSRIVLAMLTVLCVLTFTACNSTPSYKSLPISPFAGREVSNLEGYAGLEGYEGEIRLVDTDVQEVVDLLDKGETFVFFAGYEDCPYCNRILPYLLETAVLSDTYVGYLDTRKDPSWQSNMDIDDYDLLVERYGDWIDVDDDGTVHLYVPELFYVKNGVVVAAHQGVVEGADDPDVELTSAQEQALMKLLADDFNKLA